MLVPHRTQHKESEASVLQQGGPVSVKGSGAPEHSSCSITSPSQALL